MKLQVAGEGQKQKVAEENESLQDSALSSEFWKNNCYNEDSSVWYWQLTVQVADEQIGQTGSLTAPIKLD